MQKVKEAIKYLKTLNPDMKIEWTIYTADEIKDEFAEYLSNDETELFDLTDDEVELTLNELFESDSIWESIRESMHYAFDEIIKKREKENTENITDDELWDK